MDSNLADKVPRVSLARLPTPLVPIRRFCRKHDIPTIWMKRDDLTDTAASGNKLRKLEFAVGQALFEGATTLITSGGVQSNHCRATAIIASQLGLKAHLILRGSPVAVADGNLLLDEIVGANITFATAGEFQFLDELTERIANKYRQQNERPYVIPVGASDEVGLWGYIEASRELKQDFEDAAIEPGDIVSAAGSGGTAGGLIIGRHLHRLKAEVFSFNVCDDEQYFIEKISGDFKVWQKRYGVEIAADDVPINIVDGYVGPGYGRADPPVFDTIRDLARTEGIILDPVYTGKAFHGLLSEINRGNFRDTDDIVFIHTGGIFGLFPQKQHLMNSR